MKDIQMLSDMIEEEIEDAGKYAKCALEYKETNSAMADTFFKLANEEIGHADSLHKQVMMLVSEYKKTVGEPPADMLAIYKYLHGKHIDKLSEVKVKLSLYK